MEHRQAGVAAGKHIHLRLFKPSLHVGAVLRVLQMFLRKTPAGQRLRVAVHDAQPQARHIHAGPHRQRGQLRAQAWELARCAAQAAHDAVAAFDHAVAHPTGVGTAATGVFVSAGKFGFDVAAQGGVGQDLGVDALKAGGVHVEPVEVAVEDQALLAPAFVARLFCKQVQHLAQGRLVAVQATHHVQDLALQRWRGGHGAGRIAVVQRATAAWRRGGMGRGRFGPVGRQVRQVGGHIDVGHGGQLGVAEACMAQPLSRLLQHLVGAPGHAFKQGLQEPGLQRAQPHQGIAAIQGRHQDHVVVVQGLRGLGQQRSVQRRGVAAHQQQRAGARRQALFKHLRHALAQITRPLQGQRHARVFGLNKFGVAQAGRAPQRHALAGRLQGLLQGVAQQTLRQRGGAALAQRRHQAGFGQARQRGLGHQRDAKAAVHR